MPVFELSETVGSLLVPPPSLAPPVHDEYEAPAADLIRPVTEVSDPLMCLLGIPFDVTIIGRRGAKGGPAAIRQGFLSALTYEPGLGIDLSQAPRIADVGDVDVVHTNVEKTWERVSTVVEELVGTGVPLCVMGGDHGLAFPILRGIAAANEGKRIGVINVDAHFDVRISHHDEPSSGVPFRYMLERLDGAVRGSNFTEIGIGGWLNTKRYHDYLNDQGARVITMHEVRRGNWDALVDEAIERAADGTDAIWLTFDIDVIEGAVVGATNSPAIGGIDSFQAQHIVHTFAKHPKAIGMDLVEVSPPLNPGVITERQAAWLLLDFAAGKYVTRAED